MCESPIPQEVFVEQDTVLSLVMTSEAKLLQGSEAASLLNRRLHLLGMHIIVGMRILCLLKGNSHSNSSPV